MKRLTFVLLLVLASAVPSHAQDSTAVISWTEGPALQTDRDHHAVFHVRTGTSDYLCVAGGTDYKHMFADVWRARLYTDGRIAAWEPGPVLGGVENDQRFVDTIWRAPLDESGKIGAWEAVVPGLPAARAHVHNTPVVNGRVYSVGGSNMRRVSGALHVGTFTDVG